MTLRSVPLRNLRPAALCSLLALAGCANITGFDDASTEYACKAPVGVKCDSVSGTYANALQNNLPSQRPQRAPAAAAAESLPAAGPRALPASTSAAVPARLQTTAIATADVPLAQAIRSQPRLLRLWIKPWEDADRDLHDQGYIYVQIDSGRWLIDHAQRQIRDAYAPVRAPRRPAGALTDDPNAPPRAAPAASANTTGAVSDAIRALQATSRSAQPRDSVD